MCVCIYIYTHVVNSIPQKPCLKITSSSNFGVGSRTFSFGSSWGDWRLLWILFTHRQGLWKSRHRRLIQTEISVIQHMPWSLNFPKIFYNTQILWGHKLPQNPLIFVVHRCTIHPWILLRHVNLQSTRPLALSARPNLHLNQCSGRSSAWKVPLHSGFAAQ